MHEPERVNLLFGRWINEWTKQRICFEHKGKKNLHESIGEQARLHKV